MIKRLDWQQEMDIIDRTMKAISGVTDPEELVGQYWQGIGQMLPLNDYLAISRRNVTPPEFVLTRSSRFEQDINPWTHRHLLPRMSEGILQKIAYANAPVIIDDLPSQLSRDDPAYFYLEGFSSLVALPQYDDGEALNVTVLLIPPGPKLDPSFIPILHWQSSLFGRGTQNLVLRNQLTEALKSLDREMRRVGEIQRSLLPEKLPEIDGYKFAAMYRTSTQAGGDYYDVYPLDDGKWGIFIADVAGHGTPAAVLMAVVRTLLHAQPKSLSCPGFLLQELNRQLAGSYTKGGTFVTAFHAILEPRTRRLIYSRAGHTVPFLLRDQRVIPFDKPGELPLGILPGQVYESGEVQLKAGDLLLLYTDGITEAAGPLSLDETRPLYGTGRLLDLLSRCDPPDPQGCLDQIEASLSAFCAENTTQDDQTLLAMLCK